MGQKVPLPYRTLQRITAALEMMERLDRLFIKKLQSFPYCLQMSKCVYHKISSGWNTAIKLKGTSKKVSQVMAFITGQKHLANWNFLSSVPPHHHPTFVNLSLLIFSNFSFTISSPSIFLYVSVHTFSSMATPSCWFSTKMLELQSSHMSCCGPTDVYIYTNF